MEITEQSERVRDLMENGIEIAGGALSGAIGFLAAGPVAAAVFGAGGAGAAVALRRVGAEISDRLLGPRERVRLGGVLALAAAGIDERIRRGETVRQDGFFEANPSGRSDGDEVAESVLLKSQREPEERKLPYIATLLVSVAFNISVSAAMAHQLVKAAEQLSYRQLCLLRVAFHRHSFGLRVNDYRGQGTFEPDLYQVLYECHDLYQRGFVAFGGEVAFGPTDVVPGKMTPQGIGTDLYNLMGLAWIPDIDLMSIIARLK